MPLLLQSTYFGTLQIVLYKQWKNIVYLWVFRRKEMGLLVLISALIATISDTVQGRETNYWEYDYDNYHNLCTMLEEQEKENGE